MCRNIVRSRRSDDKKSKRFLFSMALLVLCIFSIDTYALDEDYLKALEAEAEDSAKVSNETKPEPKNKTKTESTSKRDEFLKFEAILEFNRPTTYRFYKKLGAEDKRTVFSVYQKDHALKKIGKVVLDLYFEQNQ